MGIRGVISGVGIAVSFLLVMCDPFSASTNAVSTTDAAADADTGDDGARPVPPAPADASPPFDAAGRAEPCVGLGSTGVCIDRTEVTVGRYRAFYAASDKPTELPARCSGSKRLAGSTQTGAADDEPVVQITWCDAFAYCLWVGKHLCRSFASDAIPVGQISSQSVDSWVAACESAPIDASTCNIVGKDGGVRPAKDGGCELGDSGVVDLIGNVWEYVDSCEPDTGYCHFVGKSWGSTPGGDGCTSQSSGPPGFTGDDLGFRCCGAP